MKQVGLWVTIILVCPLVVLGGTPPAISFHTITNGDDVASLWETADLAKWTYEETPWLTDSDMAAWNLSTNRIFLRQEKSTLLARFDPAFGGEDKKPYPYKLFMVLAEGEPCFVGGYHSMFSSLGAPYPHFSDVHFSSGPRDVLALRSGITSENPRNYPCLEVALRAAGLYPVVLEIEITDVQVSEAEAPPGSRIECDIVLANPGPIPLIVLDPGRMVPFFNEYRAGVSLFMADSNVCLVSERLKKPPGPEVYPEDGIVEIPAGGSISGTLVRKVERLAPGNYRCRVDYPGLSGLSGEGKESGEVKVFYGEARSPEFEVRIE